MSLGTLEVLLATPTPVWTLLTGAVLFPAIITSIELGLFLGFGLGLLGGGTTIGGALLAAPILALTFVSFCAFGIAGAGFVMLTKRGDPITMVAGLASTVLAGAIVPIETFPSIFQTLARAFPAYYGVRGTRLALLADASFGDVAGEILALAAFDIVLLVVAIGIFRKAIDSARRAGTLGNY